MKEQIKQPQQASRTIQSKPKAANQASVQQILQRFQSRGNVQRQTINDDELLQGKFKTAQRQEIDEDELLQGKFETVQREEFDDDELLQGKFGTIQRIEPDKKIPLQEKSEETHVLAPSSEERAGGEANNTGLPDNLKTGVENMSGYNMDDVRVHYNSPKPAQLQALAYTQGTDIHVAPGQEKHLPHEAWHVVQQKQGRVQPTTQLQGINVNDNAGLEKEADVMGGRAIQRRKISSIIQFNKDVHDTIFYGYATPRGRYLAADRSHDHSMPHLTVDTLNAAIGLTNDELMSAPMNNKRETVNNALINENDRLSQDEIAWKEWLQQRQEPLMMHDMNGEQCRADMGMDNSYWKRFKSWLFPPAQHMIRGVGDKLWKEEPHAVNIDRTIHSQPGAEATRKTWTDDEYNAHNKFVDNYDETLLNEEITNDNLRNNIKMRTSSWLQNIVMHKFWRLTSLMGMDFFIARGKHIAFIRGENEGVAPNPETGRRSITDSEWLHAQSQGYLNNGSVTRHNPIQDPS